MTTKNRTPEEELEQIENDIVRLADKTDNPELESTLDKMLFLIHEYNLNQFVLA